MKIKVDNFILWARQLPPDLNLELSKGALSHKSIYLIYGTQDEFLKNQNYEQHITNFHVASFAPQIISFDGKHEIHRENLINLSTKIVSKE